MRLFIFLFFIPCLCKAQIQDPVKWAFSSKKIADKVYEIHLTATLQKGWHIYSQTTPAGGPLPTAISYSKNPLLIIDVPAKEIGKLEKHLEPLFDVEVKQYSNKIDFTQVVKLKSNIKTLVNGTIEFMACDNRQCLPPKKLQFSIPVQ